MTGSLSVTLTGEVVCKERAARGWAGWALLILDLSLPDHHSSIMAKKKKAPVLEAWCWYCE